MAWQLGAVAKITPPGSIPTCGRKFKHQLRQTAERHLRAVVVRYDIEAGYLHTYFCPHCRFWHIGKAQRQRGE